MVIRNQSTMKCLVTLIIMVLYLNQIDDKTPTSNQHFAYIRFLIFHSNKCNVFWKYIHFTCMCTILMHECNCKTSKAISFDLITHAKRVRVKHTLHPQIHILTQFICKFGNLWIKNLQIRSWMAKVPMSILTPLDEESSMPFNVGSFRSKETKINYSRNWGCFFHLAMASSL